MKKGTKVTKDTIVVNTWAQKALLKNELLGQMSDGLWENSRNQSWEFWVKCDIVVDPDVDPHYVKTSVYFNEKAYKVNNPDLLSFIGTRMLGQAKFADFTGNEVTEKENHFIEYIVGCDDADKYPVVTTDAVHAVYALFARYAHDSKDPENYWVKEAAAYTEFLLKYGNILLDALNNKNYNKKELRKDLRVITQALSNK